LRTPGTEPTRRALVAEDDLEMRALVTGALRIDGFEVTEVGDGRDLRARTNESICDLVVSDLRLPFGDGLEALEDLHARAPETQMILMTAFADDSVRTRAATLDAVLMDKPFRLSELRAAARRLCKDVAHRGTP
jgi:DNA-binding response OmpR family regulator